MSVANMCPWTTPHMRLTRTTTTLSRTTIQSRRSWPSARTPRHPEAWSSRFVGEAMGRPTTPGNPFPRSCRGLTLPSWTTSASTRPSSMSRTSQHSPGRLQPGAPDHRPGLSPVSITGLSSEISESTLHDIAKHIIAVCRSWILHMPGAQFRLRCFRQTLSVSIFLLTFPRRAWTAIAPC